MFYLLLLVSGAFCLWSYKRAKDLGVPWFRGGKQRRRPVPIRYQQSQRREQTLKSLSVSLSKTTVVREAPHREVDCYAKLNRFTHSNDFSKRMVMWMSKRHPDKDERWCVEKIIEDMEKNPHLRTGHMRPKTKHSNLSTVPLEQSENWQYLFRKELLAADPAAFQKLNSLTHSHEVAMRLVEKIAAKHPMRNAHWCVEKAIFDIERDRMAR